MKKPRIIDRKSKPRIIAISGKQGSGKSTLAAALGATMGCQHMKFAFPLYLMHDAVCNVAKEFGLEPAKKEGKLLQFIGTEWGRETFGQDVWVNCLKHRLEKSTANLIIIDDMRFPNELAMLKEIGATTVRLECSEELRSTRTDGWRGGEGLLHSSETALDHVNDWDYVFETDGSQRVEDMVVEMQETEDE